MSLCFEFSFINPLTETNPERQLQKDVDFGEQELKKVFHVEERTKHWGATKIHKKVKHEST